MKKLLFGLIATVLFSTLSFGQTNEEISTIYNENRPVLAKLMSDFVGKLKPFYSKEDTYTSFSQKVCVPKEMSSDGNVILRKAFTYLQNGASAVSIEKNETGYEIALSYVNYTKTKTSLKYEDYLFGTSNNQARGFWASLWGGIKDAVTWIWDHIEAIFTAYTMCCNIGLCCR